jgi:hypothetical protein
MNYTKIGALPTHRYIWVDSDYTHAEPCGLVEAMWVGLTAIPGRAWGINVILREGGALYRNIPPDAIAFSSEPESDWSIRDAQLWDCYSYHFSILQNPIMHGMEVSVMLKSGVVSHGEYLFSTAHMHDGWSDAPDQDKEFIFVKLECGRLTIQPTNRVRFIDRSFTTEELPRLKVQETVYSCEK